jgi:hypothetical protein
VELARRWRRRRVRLVFDPLRATLPRGAWFSAPGSGAGQRLLAAARERPALARYTALPRVPGAPPEGFAAVCQVRGLRWGEARLGPVRYEPRVAWHVGLTLWGGLPRQEHWVLVADDRGARAEWQQGLELEGARGREGWPAGFAGLDEAVRPGLYQVVRAQLDGLLAEREVTWEDEISRNRDEEFRRLRGFFAARLAEEEERVRRRLGGAEDSGLNGGDARSIKLEWERRAAEVRARWALRVEARLWGVREWAWPVASLEQELRAGAIHVRLVGEVDVARGVPQLPCCPACGHPAALLLRRQGSVGCLQCPD